MRAPAVKNFRKAVTLYYIFAMSLWIILTYIGYWCARLLLRPDLTFVQDLVCEAAPQCQESTRICTVACCLYCAVL